MGCWAVPTIAAEVWGVPLQVVLDAITNGSLLSRTEAGMVLVDVHPNGIGAARRRSDQRPPTFSIVTRAELTALRHPASPAPESPHRDFFHTPRRQAARTRRSPQ